MSSRAALIEAGQSRILERELEEYLPAQSGQVWERLARLSVSRLDLDGRRWRPASRWWGTGLDRRPLELDVVAESEDDSALLIGEAKVHLHARDWKREIAALNASVERFPLIGGRKVLPCIWCAAGGQAPAGVVSIDARRVLQVMT